MDECILFRASNYHPSPSHVQTPCVSPSRGISLPKKILHRMRADIVVPVLVAGQAPPGLHEEGAMGSRGRVRRHGDLVLALARHIDLARLVEVGAAEAVLNLAEAVLADGDGEAHFGLVGWLVCCESMFECWGGPAMMRVQNLYE